MVRSALYAIAQDARELRDELRDDDTLPGWVTYKVYTAQDRLQPARQYLRERIAESRENPSTAKVREFAVRAGKGYIKGVNRIIIAMTPHLPTQAVLDPEAFRAYLRRVSPSLPMMGAQGVVLQKVIALADKGDPASVVEIDRLWRSVAAKSNPRRRKGTTVQSLIFDRGEFTVRTAHKWAINHGFIASEPDVTDNTIRLRQLEPSTVRVVATISLRPGVQAVIGFPKR